MKKRILIDVSTASVKTDGLTCYIMNIIRNFPDEFFDHFDATLLVNPALKRDDLSAIIAEGRFKVLYANIPPIGPRRDIAMFLFWRKVKRNYDVFHSTSNQYPLCIKNGIATIHDITFKFYFDEKWWTFGSARRYLDMVIRNTLRRAGTVIAVSNATRQSLIDSYHLSQKQSDKIKVVYEGWEHLINDQRSEAELKINGRYFFYTGTSRRHKNMKGLLSAFREALPGLPGDVNLVLSGIIDHLSEEDKKLTNEINEKGKRVFFTGFVSKAELESLFRNCDAFIFPSLCEGFGIPVLETFYFGKPLLCSNTTSLPEIAGDAALYFDPTDIHAIAAAMQQFYNEPGLAASLAEKGRERLKEFSWKKAARETFELYQQHFEKH